LSAGLIGDAGVAGNLGAGPSSGVGIVLNGGTLQYTGAGESTNRQIQLNSGSSSSTTANPLGGSATYTKNNTTSTLDASGTGAIAFTNPTLSLSGTSAITLTLTGTNTGANTFAAAMKDNTLGKFSLNKTGAGKWVATGASTYTGATAVTGGTLLVNGSLGATAVSVTGATFGGSGTVGGAVTVGSGGVLAPGSDAATIGTFSIASATLTDGAALAFDINTAAGTSDLLALSGNLSLSGTVGLTLNDLGGGAAFNGTLTLATYSGAWNGGLLTYNGVALADGSSFVYGADSYTIHYGANALTLTGMAAIPEPPVWLLAAVGLGGAMLMRARRRAPVAGEVV
ncbi:MAG TPA: autotransporter-associated beta strand repeat-containing protein, partial [Candidatus Methylacidiphilales bacterium]